MMKLEEYMAIAEEVEAVDSEQFVKDIVTWRDELDDGRDYDGARRMLDMVFQIFLDNCLLFSEVC